MPVHDLNELLQHAKPKLQPGAFAFVTLTDWPDLPVTDILMSFRESEGMTFILEQSIADQLDLRYEFVAAWIIMEVNSALEVVGFTAAFATALGQHNISCNVVAAFHHDHIFVAQKDGDKAIEILQNLSDQPR